MTLNLTPKQFALLQAVAAGEVRGGLQMLQQLNATTLGSLSQRAWIEYTTSGLRLTRDGMLGLEAYKNGEVPRRKYPREVTERVATLLHIAARRLAKHAQTRRNFGIARGAKAA